MTNYWPGDYVVGSNTFANGLMIRNRGVLTNADGYVGYLPASSSNYVMVAGAGSVWSNANLYLGFSGSGNTMVITNAGHVANSQGTYVAYNATSSSNRVLVTGTNSVLELRQFSELGYAGSGNSLVISNGGQVIDSYSDSATITPAAATARSSPARVRFGATRRSCTIGRSGSNNKMTINKGGRVVSNYASLGMLGSANSNSVVVSDSGSLWDDSAERFGH